MTKVEAFKDKYLRKIATFCLVVTVIASAFISHFRVNSYSVGYEEAILLGRLGIFTGYEEGIDDTQFRDFLETKAKMGTAVISFKRMQGAYNIDGVDGQLLNEDEMYLYYKYLNIDAVPDLMPAGAKADDPISSEQAYAMAALALGYVEEEPAVTAEPISELTNGELACIIYETFYAVPNGADIQVYRIRANINSDFKRLLLENGLYDDIPQEFVPIFVNGIYSQNTFFAFLGENKEGTKPKNEWGAKYVLVSDTEASDYIELLKTNGYKMDSQYKLEQENEIGDVYEYVVTLLYKTVEYDFKGEIIDMTAYCVLKYDIENEVLEWNLLI